VTPAAASLPAPAHHRLAARANAATPAAGVAPVPRTPLTPCPAANAHPHAHAPACSASAPTHTCTRACTRATPPRLARAPVHAHAALGAPSRDGRAAPSRLPAPGRLHRPAAHVLAPRARCAPPSPPRRPTLRVQSPPRRSPARARAARPRRLLPLPCAAQRRWPARACPSGRVTAVPPRRPRRVATPTPLRRSAPLAEPPPARPTPTASDAFKRSRGAPRYPHDRLRRLQLASPSPQRRRTHALQHAAAAPVAPPPRLAPAQGRGRTGSLPSLSSLAPCLLTSGRPRSRRPWPQTPAAAMAAALTPPAGPMPQNRRGESNPEPSPSFFPHDPGRPSALSRRPKAAAGEPRLPCFPVRGGGGRWQFCH